MVMLYEFNDIFNDFMIYKEKLMYIFVMCDSFNIFEIINVKEGRYKLLVLKEKFNDYIF